MRIHKIHSQAPGDFSPRCVGVISSLAASLTLCACLAFCPTTAHGQVQGRPSLDPPTMPGMHRGHGNEDPSIRRMTEKMARERNTIRQEKIEADTARLLQLAKELNADVSHSSKNTLSLNVLKDADEIEKLAKTIKKKMRDGT